MLDKLSLLMIQFDRDSVVNVPLDLRLGLDLDLAEVLIIIVENRKIIQSVKHKVLK